MLDINGYRAARRAELKKVAEEAVKRVKVSGRTVALEPMNPFERKVCHDVVAAAGLTSESEGVEPLRHVVVLPDRESTEADSLSISETDVDGAREDAGVGEVPEKD